MWGLVGIVAIAQEACYMKKVDAPFQKHPPKHWVLPYPLIRISVGAARWYYLRLLP